MTKKDFINKHCQMLFDGEAKEFTEDLTSLLRKEAEGFGEWLRNGKWVRNNRTTWIRFFFQAESEIKTTSELYDEYERREK